MMQPQSGLSEEDHAQQKAYMIQYEAQQTLDKRRASRAAALEAALRCAQPGAHADAVIETARQFLAWLSADDA